MSLDPLDALSLVTTGVRISVLATLISFLVLSIRKKGGQALTSLATNPVFLLVAILALLTVSVVELGLETLHRMRMP